MRVMGRAAFLDLRDSAPAWFQAMLRQNVLGVTNMPSCQELDLGDFLGVDGNMMRTRTGQPTIEAHALTILAKGMRPLPEKVARTAGRGNPLPPALSRPDRKPGGC